MLEVLATAILVFAAVYCFFKFIWGPSQDSRAKQQAYIRDLEWRKRQIDNGLNPDGMPYGYDHSCDYHNFNCGCDQCKTVSKKNDALLERDADIRKKLLNI